VSLSYSPANLRNNVSPDHIVTTHTRPHLVNPQRAEKPTEEELWRARIAMSMTQKSQGVKEFKNRSVAE
jgi:hypothetical protein